ncbi:hypothetical protein [Peribacillus muralis]
MNNRCDCREVIVLAKEWAMRVKDFVRMNFGNPVIWNSTLHK